MIATILASMVMAASSDWVLQGMLISDREVDMDVVVLIAIHFNMCSLIN